MSLSDFLASVYADRPSWHSHAACHPTRIPAGLTTSDFFPERGGQTGRVIAVCLACPVAQECREHALEHPEKQGVWGGTSEKQRRKMRRQLSFGRPCVECRRNQVTGTFLYCSDHCRNTARLRRKREQHITGGGAA